VQQVMALHGGSTQVLRTGVEGSTLRLVIAQTDPD